MNGKLRIELENEFELYQWMNAIQAAIPGVNFKSTTESTNQNKKTKSNLQPFAIKSEIEGW